MFEKGDIVSAQNIYLHNCESRINESDVNLSSDIANRTVMSITGLPPDTILIFYKSFSNAPGSRFITEEFRIENSDDMLEIKRFSGPNLEDKVSIIPNRFSQFRDYRNNSMIIAHKYDIPFRLAMALGPDVGLTYDEFLIQVKYAYLDYMLIRKLCSGIKNRKSAIKQILTSKIYNEFSMSTFGHKYSIAVRDFILIEFFKTDEGPRRVFKANYDKFNMDSYIGCHNPHKIYDLLCRVIFGSNPKNNAI